MIEESVTLREAAELERKAAKVQRTPDQHYNALKQRIRRKRIPLLPDSDKYSRKRIRISNLSEGAAQIYLEERLQSTARPSDIPQQGLCTSQVRADFVLTSPGATADDPHARVPAAIPESQRPYAEMWEGGWLLHSNGKWRDFDGKKPFEDVDIVVHGPEDFLRAWATHNNTSRSKAHRVFRTIRKELVEHKCASREEALSAALQKILPRRPSGRVSIFDWPAPEYRWMRETLWQLYENQAQFSVRRAHEMLRQEVVNRRANWKLGHAYVVPTLRQVRTELKRVPLAQKVLAREGEKAYNDRCAPYISRDPESLRSNDIWVTDQKQVDVRLRGAGEQLGRIWMVSFMDARSWKIMGYWFGPVLSSDMVISAAAMSIDRHGVPGSILMDLGKEFACTAFSGSFRKIKGETLLREAQGLCQRLGIEVIKAIGRNPQTKPIERWHNVVSEFDKNIPGWCGRNTEERPEALAAFERQHQEWKSTGRGRSPLFTIHQYLHTLVDWIENKWNSGHRGRGKYLRGMTPNECWNTHLPQCGARRITASELDLATADHRVLKVARGGQINITLYGQTIEYQAPELFLHQGKELEVILNRRGISRITVLDKSENGRFLCEAKAKPLFHWGQRAPEDREELRQAIRIRNAAKKAIGLGNAARRVLEVTTTPAEIGPSQPPIREISSTEFRSRKLWPRRPPRTETAEEGVRRMLELQGE